MILSLQGKKKSNKKNQNRMAWKLLQDIQVTILLQI